MSADSSPLISVDPSKVLFIEVSRGTDNYTTDGKECVLLRNLTDAKVLYKLESNVSELYYFKPRYGCLDPKQGSLVDVFLLSFDLDYPANGNHEIIVQSMLAVNEEEEDFPQLFEHTNQAQIVTNRVKCIPYRYGELAIEPNQELLFEASLALPFSSNISLHNPNSFYLNFNVQTSSTNLSVFPSQGAVDKYDSVDLIVIRKPLTLTDTNANNDTIIIRESEPSSEFGQDHGQTKVTKIKCVYNTPKTSSTGDCQRSISDLRNVD